jgi:hypothetical protein
VSGDEPFDDVNCGLWPQEKDEDDMSTATTLDKPGTVMPDGTIYAGVSPDTGKPIYATPKDAVSSFLCFPKRTFTLRQAFAQASAMDAYGHQDWRVPTRAELNVLFQNRGAIGNFNTSGSTPAGWYWSSSRNILYDHGAWAQRFSDGGQGSNYRAIASALRCVRG